MSRAPLPGSPLFWRVFLSGLLALSGLAALFATAGGLAAHFAAEKRPPHRLSEFVGMHLSEAVGSPERLAAEVRRSSEILGGDIAVFDPSGQLLASTGAPPAAPTAAERARADLGELEPSGAGEHQLVALHDGARPAGYAWVRVGPPRHLHGLAWLISLALVLAVLAGVSFLLARAVTTPLERLTGAARALGAGDLSVRTGLRRNDELGELARAFDEMAERLAQLIFSEKELLANASHELRTPLASVRVALELASEKGAGPAQEYLLEIGSSMDEMERLVSDLLTAARLDLALSMPGPGVPSLDLQRLEGAAVLQQAARRFRHNFPGRELELEAPLELPEVEADPTLLWRLLDNLLDNARKYSDPGQPVRLVAREGPGSLVIEVCDRGIGIDAADLDRLFTPFFRTDRSRARDTGGVGLGLAIARRIADAHRGTLCVESEVGRGTTLRLELPRAPGLG